MLFVPCLFLIFAENKPFFIGIADAIQFLFFFFMKKKLVY